jgi:hypothetical protein
MSSPAPTPAETQQHRRTLRPHPTRDKIVDAMRSHGRPISPTRVAEIIGTGIGPTAYHFRKLVSAGYLRPAGEGRVRGSVEHFYELIPENSELVAPEELLLRAASTLTVASEDGYPTMAVLDEDAKALLAAELEQIVPRVREIVADSHRRSVKRRANG